MSQKIDTVVFPVAGMGTRFLPATKAVPKEMLPVVDKPLIQWAVEEAAAAGCTRFVFVTSPEKGAIMSHFGDAPHYQEMLEARGKTRELALLKAGLPKNAEIFETYQDAPLGLGHAIWCAREATGDKPFAVILPDDMVQHQTGCLAQMAAHYETVGGNLVAVENVPSEETYRYGVLNPGAETDDLVEVKGLVEKPAPEDAPSTLAIIGRYILDAKIMDTLSAFKKGAGGEIQITDAMAELIGHVPMHGFRFAGTRYDCGNRDGFLEANLAFALAQGGDELKQRLRQLLD
ncbi:MAG: UTP--glucose-1-phosphate uridylyltransferase [Rhodobiaceae bacterium]|nr:UTP--glucose-1-phosphate uridylyltransferase [Rhodobiaceae bacterium]|tara:strand:- start:473 stop:1339 length:867 start_codon:yes stop_codon:yes gene_type:complete